MFPAPIFPARMDLGVPWIGPHLVEKNPLYVDLEVGRGEKQGFAYCFPIALRVTPDFGGPFDASPAKKSVMCRIDGHQVFGTRNCEFGLAIFERDEAVFGSRALGLGSNAGADQ